MDTLASGFTALLNGLAMLLSHAVNPVVLSVLVAALSLAWLAIIEIEELDRQGTKPHVVRH